MKTLLLALTLTLLSFSQSADTYVYVCDSETSTSFHSNKDCRGLQKCTHEIIVITAKDAEKMGKRPCKICYRVN